jgi:hypothetical protein
MKSVVFATVAAVAAAQSSSILTMASDLDSKINMGNSVLNSYCKSDLQPSFARAYDEAVKTEAGVVNTITLGLVNVPTTCAGNFGSAPCATDAGADKWPSFVCTFTAEDGSVEKSAAVQGLRVEDRSSSGKFYGVEAMVKCEMPARANIQHSVTVSLEYMGKTNIAIPFSGKAGNDEITVYTTGSPTKAPTKNPTNSPTLDPTIDPILLTGCKSEVSLNQYYRACTSSSEKPSQFYSAKHKSGETDKTSYYRSLAFFFSTETRYFFW